MKVGTKPEGINRKDVLVAILTFFAGLIISVSIGFVCRGINLLRYKTAEQALLDKDYENAYEQFGKLGYFKDSYERRNEANRGLMLYDAQELVKSEEYEEAVEKYEEIIRLSDIEDEIKRESEDAAIELRYNMAEKICIGGDKKKAIENYEKIVALYSYSNNELVSKSKDRITEIKYLLAKEYFDKGEYSEADALFKEIEEYLDSSAYVARIATMNDTKDKEAVYQKAISLMEDGEYEEAIKWFMDIEGYSESTDKIEECKKMLKMKNLNHVIATGISNSFAIDKNHDVKSVGRSQEQQRDVNNDDWKDIISLDCYGSLTVGLKSNQKVVITGLYNGDKQIDMESLENIVDVTAGEQFIAVLDKNGQVYADGLIVQNWDLSEWNDVIDIDAGWNFLVGLTKDHKLRFAGVNTEFFMKQYSETDWKNVISISAGGGGNHPKRRDDGHGHIVGLKDDGSVVAIGDDNYKQCSEAKNNWDKIVRISAGDWYTVGLTEDGGVLITGENFDGSYYIDRSLGKEGLRNLENIVEVAAGFGQTLCLRSDGTIYPFGFEENELYETKDWQDILLPIY